MAKYSKKSQSKVKRAMHEMKSGKLKSGRSGKKVKSRKQAIAIGLSEQGSPALRFQRRNHHQEENQVAAEKSPADNWCSCILKERRVNDIVQKIVVLDQQWLSY
jgi:hypothetical protein